MTTTMSLAMPNVMSANLTEELTAKLTRTLLPVALSGMLVLAFGQGAFAQSRDLDQAAQAVVRIRACDASGCDRGVGSGVIIDSSGVILTANHVTLSDPDDPLSDPLNDFVIEITTDWRTVPEARYHASLAAGDRTSDLALLQIYWDEVDQRDVKVSELELPALPLAERDAVELGERLHFLGYPLLGGATINYLDISLSGFDGADSSLLKVTGALLPGYSGGPGLIERSDGFHVVGVVSRQRFVQGSDRATGKVGLIRSVDALPGLDWRPAARRVWVEDVYVAPVDPDAVAFTIALDLRALDFANRRGLAMAYAYDAASGEPWTPQQSDLPTTTTGQVVLSDDFTVTGFLEKRRILLRRPIDDFLRSPDELAFRIVLWDVDGERAVWRDTEWRRPEALYSPSTRSAWQWPSSPSAVAQSITRPAIGPVVTPSSTPLVGPSPTPLSTSKHSREALTCRVLVPALRLRAGPGTTYVAKGMLDPSTKVTALARDPTTAWIEVGAESGLRGWINNSSTYVACAAAVADLPIGDTAPLPTPTTTPVVVSSAGPHIVDLLSPADGANSRDPLTFSWQPDAALANGQVYELVFWEPNKGQTHEQGGGSWLDASAATTVTLDPSAHAPETYAWGVWLGVFDENGIYSRIRYLGGGYSFTVPSSNKRERRADKPVVM